MRTRPLFAALALAAAAVLSATAPAAAHGDSVHLDVSGQRNGHVSTVATWENDHDPVTEDFAGTLSATAADGRTAGPWRLVAVPGSPGTYTTREILPAGHWKVTVECAFPSLGHGEREFDVAPAAVDDPPTAFATATGAAGSPVAAPVAGPTVAATPVGDASHEAADGGVSRATFGAAAAAAVVLLAAAGRWLRRRR
ncbi:hypothetical protein [Streptomyces rubellomurinus]|uniref:hypothetical protein n=1 Tax=Streptomyces rubellomurinus (strain ATCC 31215) TaxID=359131 RepID=UPI000697D10B|nr:hypothetical protein [Streptomyces rubellomurinus]